MMESIQMAIPDVEVQCFDLGSVSIQQQVLLVEQASVHVSPHGGLSLAHRDVRTLCCCAETEILRGSRFRSYLSRAHEEVCNQR